MMHTDFIAAIQLGTSHLTGIVGKREPNGSFTVIACETEDSAGCIRRGCIRNVNETASKIKAVIAKLQNRMPGSRIGKVFVGLGGQSVHSREIAVSRLLDRGTKVSDNLMDELKDESIQLQPEDLDILDVLEPACYLDGRLESNPVGTLCSAIDAKYQQIVARHSLRSNVSEAVKSAGLKDVAEIIVSPLALADTVLGKDEKEMGCALIDFGAGVTSVTVYKHGRLLGMSVIPLGGSLITKDISNHFGIVESDAEKIKQDYGKAVVDDDNPDTISVNTIDRKDLCTIKLKEFFQVISARQKEIIENVFARIKEYTGEKEAGSLKNFLRAGIYITGNAAKLPQIDMAISDCVKIDVHLVSSVRRDIDIKGVYDMNPDFVSIGLLLHAQENYTNCAVAVTQHKHTPEPPKEKPQPEVTAVNIESEEENNTVEKGEEAGHKQQEGNTGTPKGGGKDSRSGRISKGIGRLFDGLFPDE